MSGGKFIKKFPHCGLKKQIKGIAKLFFVIVFLKKDFSSIKVEKSSFGFFNKIKNLTIKEKMYGIHKTT